MTDKAKMVTSQYLWVRLPWSKLVVAHICFSVLSVDGTVTSNLMTEELVVSMEVVLTRSCCDWLVGGEGVPRKSEEPPPVG